MKEDVFSLPEGPVVIRYPARMSPESFSELEEFMHLWLRTTKRSTQAPGEQP